MCMRLLCNVRDAVTIAGCDMPSEWAVVTVQGQREAYFDHPIVSRGAVAVWEARAPAPASAC
nr:unnamed protein product [Callosobruchus chinensis]